MSMKIKFLTLTSLVVPALLASFAANASDGTWKSGEHIYNKVCAQCHETNGDIGPVLAGRNLAPIYVVTIVRNGLRAMPAFPASFVDDEILQQAGEYIQTLPAPSKESL